MKKKAAKPLASKKTPKKPVKKGVRKASGKTPKPTKKKQAAKKKSARKAKAPLLVLRKAEALQEAGPLGDALVADEPVIHETSIEELEIEGPANIAEESAIHEAISIETAVVSMSADTVSKEALSAELPSDVEEDLRFGREFMKKYQETFRALAK